MARIVIRCNAQTIARIEETPGSLRSQHVELEIWFGFGPGCTEDLGGSLTKDESFHSSPDDAVLEVSTGASETEAVTTTEAYARVSKRFVRARFSAHRREGKRVVCEVKNNRGQREA